MRKSFYLLLCSISFLQSQGQLQVTISVLEPIKCYGDSNGKIVAHATGGTAPYQFHWTGPGTAGQTDSIIINLGPGGYSVTVTDANTNQAISNDLLLTEP